jgi:hypothetical protein
MDKHGIATVIVSCCVKTSTRSISQLTAPHHFSRLVLAYIYCEDPSLLYSAFVSHTPSQILSPFIKLYFLHGLNVCIALYRIFRAILVCVWFLFGFSLSLFHIGAHTHTHTHTALWSSRTPSSLNYTRTHPSNFIATGLWNVLHFSPSCIVLSYLCAIVPSPFMAANCWMLVLYFVT